MLALSRKKDEAVIINDDIEITIIEIKGDQVKIGISAPKSVPIYRKEVYMQIQQGGGTVCRYKKYQRVVCKKIEKRVNYKTHFSDIQRST